MMQFLKALFAIMFQSGKSPWHDGNEAYKAGSNEKSNPHIPGTIDHQRWRDGFYGTSSK